MSARNGDKARFGKQRKRKMAHRARTRVLRDSLQPGAPVTAASTVNTAKAAEPLSGETHAEEAHKAGEHGALGSAAGAIGSALGSLAAKVRGVKEPETAHAE